MSDFNSLMNAFQEGYALTDPQLREARAKEKRDEESNAKKMELAKQLEMQIYQMKEEYSRQNPKYVHFANTPEGIVGFTDQGTSKMLQEYSPQQKDLANRERDAAIKQKLAAANYANANADSLKDYRQSLIDKNNRPPAGRAPKSRADLVKLYTDAAAKQLGPAPKAPTGVGMFMVGADGKSGLDKFNEDYAAWQQKRDSLMQEAEAQADRDLQSGGNAPPQGLLNPGAMKNPFMESDDEE